MSVRNRRHLALQQPFAPHAVQVYRTTGRRRRFMRWLVTFSVLLNLGLVAFLVAATHRLGCLVP